MFDGKYVEVADGILETHYHNYTITVIMGDDGFCDYNISRDGILVLQSIVESNGKDTDEQISNDLAAMSN